MSSQAHINIVIIGHVDHGKSTLIGRLLLDTNSLPKEKLAEIKKISSQLGKETELAYLTDQLKEEREQEKTIDTTQIFFKSRRRRYCIIDAPGHVEFIKNMLTGASQAKGAVLIVDAQAGIKEQTQRHAYLIAMLGIENIIVVFNKMDLAAYEQRRFEELKKELMIFLTDLKIKPKFFIPVSAKDGQNISAKSPKMRWHKGPYLLQALGRFSVIKGLTKRPLRFSVQDSYKIKNEEITVGKVLSGVIKSGQKITMFPSSKNSIVKAIRIFGKNPKKASAGENIGIILANPEFAERGEVIAGDSGLPRCLNRFKAEIFWLADAPLQINKSLALRCSAQQVSCRIERIESRMNSSTLEILEENASQLKTNEAAAVIIKTEKPVVLENFEFIEELGRFVLEDNYNLQAAGIITAARQNRTSPNRFW